MERWWNRVPLGPRKGSLFGNACKGCAVRFSTSWPYFMPKYAIFDFCCKTKHAKSIPDIVLESSRIDKERTCDNGNCMGLLYFSLKARSDDKPWSLQFFSVSARGFKIKGLSIAKRQQLSMTIHLNVKLIKARKWIWFITIPLNWICSELSFQYSRRGLIFRFCTPVHAKFLYGKFSACHLNQPSRKL